MNTHDSFDSDGMLDDKIGFEIHRDGFTLVSIEAGAHLPAVTYTLGVSIHYTHPDMVVVGLDQDAAGHFLTDLAAWIIGGHSVEPGIRYRDHEGTDADFQVYVLPEGWREPLFGRNLKYLNESDDSVLGVVFPNTSGLYPRDLGFVPDADTPQVDLRNVDPPVYGGDDDDFDWLDAELRSMMVATTPGRTDFDWLQFEPFATGVAEPVD